MNMIEKKRPPSHEEQQVIDYLNNNPDFFSKFPQVLEALYLPHNSGAAVSLIEKQLSVLRDRNTELRTQLAKLMETSKVNDNLFTKSRKLILKLIEAASVEEVISELAKSFREDFEIEFSRLTLLDSEMQSPGLDTLPIEVAKEVVPSIIDSDEALCGVLRFQQLTALFDENAKNVGSAVALRLAVDKKPYGILALGNRDSHYYYNGMDTLFLRFLADILNQVLYPKL